MLEIFGIQVGFLTIIFKYKIFGLVQQKLNARNTHD